VDAEAACVVCHSDANPALMLVCDECNDLYHLKCAGEKRVPKQDIWNCPPCAAIRRAQVSSALRGNFAAVVCRAQAYRQAQPKVL
jgi:hypothetical protein